VARAELLAKLAKWPIRYASHGRYEQTVFKNEWANGRGGLHGIFEIRECTHYSFFTKNTCGAKLAFFSAKQFKKSAVLRRRYFPERAQTRRVSIISE
jgi:hypothetical protein